MTRRAKQWLIMFFTFIGGFYFFLEFLLPKESGLDTYHDQITKALQMIGVATIGLGILNILRVYGERVVKLKKGWGNALALIVGMFAVFAIQGFEIRLSEQNLGAVGALKTSELFVQRIQKDFIEHHQPAAPRIAKLLEFTDQTQERFISLFESRGAAVSPAADEIDSFREGLVVTRTQVELYRNLAEGIEKKIAGAALTDIDRDRFTRAGENLATRFRNSQAEVRPLLDKLLQQTTPSVLSKFITVALFGALGSAMFSLLAFYIASASYRAFRVRSLEALTMMIAAVIVILGQIPFGPLYISESMPQWRMWLLQYVNVPAFRAIYFGAAIAGLAMAVRMWLSLEPSPLGADDWQSHRSEGET